MKREIFWEEHSDSTSFPSGGRKIYHERSAIGDMLSAIQNKTMRGLGSHESSLYSYMGEKMLSVSDLIDINYIPSESDISLELLVDFYEDYLCKRIFIFTLRDGQVVKLFFRNATELFHVSGIDHVYEGVPMLITEGNNAGKFIGKADEKLKVSKLEIRDKDTNQLLIIVERELAEQTALAEVEKYSEEWFSKELPILLKKHFFESVGNKIFEALTRCISYEWMQKVGTIDKDIEAAWNMKEEEADSSEWLRLLLDVLNEKLSDVIFVRAILATSPELITEHEVLLADCIRASNKKAWSLACRKYIEQNKSDIKDKVKKLDSYWVGKIVGEAIRKYDKEELEAALMRHITEYITLELENVVTELLTEKLSEQKAMVLEKISTLFA